MARIAKMDKYVEALKKTISADVYYHMEKNRHNSTGFFFVVIPDEFNALHEQFEHAKKFHNRGTYKIIVFGDSADDVMRKYGDYLKMFTDATSVTVKVILYRFNFSSKNKTSDPVKPGKPSFDGTVKSHEAKIEFDFAVFEKTDFNGKLTYKALDEKKNDFRASRDRVEKPVEKTGASYGSWVELPYNEDTEAFFNQVYSGMEGIMDKLAQYIQTKEQVTKSIKNHQKLLA